MCHKFHGFLASSFVGKIVFAVTVIWQNNKPLTQSQPFISLCLRPNLSRVICTELHSLILTSTFSVCVTPLPKDIVKVAFRDGGAEFRHPLVVIQDIVAYPVRIFHDGSEFLHQVLLRVFLSVAIHGLCVDPHANCESGTHPIFPTFSDVHHCHSVGKNGFCLCDISEVESVVHEGQTKLPQNVIPRDVGPFRLARDSAIFSQSSNRTGFSLLSILLTSREQPHEPVLQPRRPEAIAKT